MESNDDKFCFKLMDVPVGSIEEGNISNAPVTFDEDDVELYLIRTLGLGSISDCCLAMNGNLGENTKFCAVKFFVHDTGSGAIQDMDQLHRFCKQEEENWTACYPELRQYTCRGTACDGRPYFCMPYFEPIEKEERETVLNDGSLQKAFARFADKSCAHSEADRWHHIGRFQGEIYILDLDYRTIIQNNSDVSWINESLTKLKWRL